VPEFPENRCQNFRNPHGVTLVGVVVRECERCGEREVAIPNVEGLHRCIARVLAERRSALLGTEVRFLCKWLGYSGQDFAQLMGVTPETVSRWENSKRVLPSVADRALRLMVLRSEPVESYDLGFFTKIAPATFSWAPSPTTSPPFEARGSGGIPHVRGCRGRATWNRRGISPGSAVG